MNHLITYLTLLCIANFLRTCDSIASAFVISTSANISHAVAHAAKSCGFSPQYFPAVRPFGAAFDFNPGSMYKRCVGIYNSSNEENFLSYSKRTAKFKFTLTEMALVCSHRAVLERIASDPSITENEWSLIMEDDAILSENVTSIAAMDVVSRSLAEIDQRRARSPTPLQHGFAYFGMCRGDCTNSALDGILGVNCRGLCTHAYAVTKLVAQHLFDLVYDDKLLNNPNVKIDADQALLEYFARRDAVIRPYLLGFHLVVSKAYKRGIMVQYVQKEKKKYYHGGTSLHGNNFVEMNCYHFSPNSRVSTLSKEDFHRINGSGSSSSSSSGENNQLSIGDAMFTYAALVGICFNKKTHPDYCASSFIANAANFSSVSALRTIFDIPLPADYLQCRYPQNTSKKVSYLNVNSYNTKVYQRPSDTVFVGRMNSYRYFYSGSGSGSGGSSIAGQLLRSRFTFPLSLQALSHQVFRSPQEMVALADSKSASSHLAAVDSPRVACLVATKETWAQKSAYYQRAIGYFMQRSPPVDIFAVFFEDAYDYQIPPELGQLVQSKTPGKSPKAAYKLISAMANIQDYNSTIGNSEHYSFVLLHRLSLCQALILSGSSLSWWAGWLATNATAVFAPSGLQGQKHYYLPHWTQL